MPDPSGEPEAGYIVAAQGASGAAGGDDVAQQDNSEAAQPHRLISWLVLLSTANTVVFFIRYGFIRGGYRDASPHKIEVSFLGTLLLLFGCSE